MTITLTILAVLLSILSGFAKAVCDLSEEEKIKGNPKMWWKRISSVNKWLLDSKNQIVYKAGKKVERFWGSSRWFVAFTDWWHRFNDVRDICFGASCWIAGYLLSFSSWYWFMLALYPLQRLSFHLFYTSKILHK